MAMTPQFALLLALRDGKYYFEPAWLPTEDMLSASPVNCPIAAEQSAHLFTYTQLGTCKLQARCAALLISEPQFHTIEQIIISSPE